MPIHPCFNQQSLTLTSVFFDELFSFCDKNTDAFAIEIISFCLHLIQNNFEVSIWLKLPAVSLELELNRFLFYPTSRFDLLAFFI